MPMPAGNTITWTSEASCEPRLPHTFRMCIMFGHEVLAVIRRPEPECFCFHWVADLSRHPAATGLPGQPHCWRVSSLLPTAEAIECLPRWEVAEPRRAIKTGTDNANSCATLSATVLPWLGVTNSPKLAQARGHGDMQQSRIDSEETCDNSGDSEPHENMRPLGIEPRTHRLKVCCSTS